MGIIQRLKQWLHLHENPSEDSRITSCLNKGECPDCGGQLMLGPQGGACINVACQECFQEFNVLDAGDTRVLIERLGLLPALRAYHIYGIDTSGDPTYPKKDGIDEK
jgi:hypothetical protein